jgi:DNA repair protein RecN (Recombination protein N)
MPKARFEVRVGGEEQGAEQQGPANLGSLAGDDVTFFLSANPGGPLLPLSKVASGGELARAMLALRLALLTAGRGQGAPGPPVSREGPFTLVFDEVDAGVGGEAALAVGRALSELSTAYQVLVVTHLPQVAAFADHQVVVRKEQSRGSTRSVVTRVEGQARVTELARMLSGQPASQSGRRHAAELLSIASKDGKLQTGLRTP